MATPPEPPRAPVSAPAWVTAVPATTAVVRDVVPMAALRDFFDASFRDLARVLASQGIAVVGPAFGRYRGPLGPPGATVDLEVGFVTDRAVRPDGSVVPGTLPGGRTARLTHAGAFDGLAASWERLRAWIEEQGLSPLTDRWEVYVTQPTPETDPATLRTELNWPVAD